MKKILIFMLLLGGLGCCFLSPSEAGVLIIANKSVSQETLDKVDVRKIFLGKLVKWPDDSNIRFATVESDSHQEFLKMYINRSSSQFKNYWRKMVFTGKGRKPKSFQTDEELIQFVSKTDGAIGYVRSDASLKDVKTITMN